MAHHYMGDYEVVSHMETPECSLRLLRLSKDKYVRLHHHHKTNQIYFVLDGSIQASVGGKSVTLQRLQNLRIPADVLHSIHTDKEALVLSISIPPLEADDQHLAAKRQVLPQGDGRQLPDWHQRLALRAPA